LGLPSY